MKRITLIMSVLLLSIAAHAQVVDLYGKKGLTLEQRDVVTSFQVARHLLDGTQWNDQQRLFLEQIIISPRSSKAMQDAPLTLFTTAQVKDIFYAFNIDLTKYRSVLQLSSFKDEKQFMVSQTDATRSGLWRDHFAEFASKLSFDQLEFVYRINLWLNNPRDKKTGIALLKESRGLFDLATGRALFGQIGKHAATCGVTTSSLGADCVCSVGSSFNWSCTNDCAGGGSCHETPDGCGFLGWFTCSGSCKTGDVEIEPPPIN